MDLNLLSPLLQTFLVLFSTVYFVPFISELLLHETLSAAHVHAQYTSSEGGLENHHTQGAMKNDCKLNPRLVAAILWRDAGATSPDVVGSRIRMSDEFAQDGLSIGVKNGETTALRGS